MGIKKHIIPPDAQVIPLWPLPFDPNNTTPIEKKARISPKALAMTLVVCWVILFLILLISQHAFGGGHVYTGYFQCLKALALGAVWVLSKPKGTTHVQLDRTGITLLSKAGYDTVGTKHTPWFQIRSISVEPGKSKHVTDGYLSIKTKNGSQRIKLNKFADSQRWRKFVELVKKNITDDPLKVKLDEHYLDHLSETADYSFTRLWLESLAAPPRRQRLQPLTDGITLQNNRFTIKHHIGSGAQGNAYLATCADRGEVVLKEFILPLYVDARARKAAITEFERESAMLGKLSHPGIIKVYDTFVEDQRAYLVLECAQGQNLKQIVEGDGAFSEERACEIGIELCSILTHLHTQAPPLVHQDFTPDNLILTPTGIKLIDFSGTRALEGRTTAIVGKRSYMPPEQFRGEPRIQSDVFALGCTLAFLTTGVEPEPISQSHPKALKSSLSDAFNRIVEKATAVNLTDRYDSAASLAADLQALTQTQSLILNTAVREKEAIT